MNFSGLWKTLNGRWLRPNPRNADLAGCGAILKTGGAPLLPHSSYFDAFICCVTGSSRHEAVKQIKNKSQSLPTASEHALVQIRRIEQSRRRHAIQSFERFDFCCTGRSCG